jgi:P4 family phage/plasmid primase-like protien
MTREERTTKAPTEVKLPEALAPLVEYPRPHWVIWKLVRKPDGSFTKVPYQARYPQRKAETNDPSTWATFDEAVAAAAKFNADGIGFVLTDTDIAAFDIDHCRNSETGHLHPWAEKVMGKAASYTEVTPSETGIRIIGRATGDKLSYKRTVGEGVSCEFYRKATRYITITGDHIWNRPLANIDEVLDTAYAELNELKGKKRSTNAAGLEVDDVTKNGRYERFVDDAGKPDKSRAVYFVICARIREGWSEDEIVEVLLNRENKISEHGYEAHPEDPEGYARDQIRRAREDIDARLVSTVDHMERARRFHTDQRPNLRYWRGDFYDWTDTSYYQAIGKDAITAQIWRYLDKAETRNKDGKIRPFWPNGNLVNETLAALKAIVQLDDKRETPFWITGGIAGELIAFPNGLLELSSDKFYSPTPNFFTLGALGFKYAPKRGEPKAWLDFLDQIFDKAADKADAEAQIQALQEIFGYLLTSDISQEKCFMLLGPPRSGKGTMARIMSALLASSTVAGPTLSDLGTEFGLSALIGKLLAILDDLRISRKDQNLMVENVLKITGRGHFTINRKYLSHWTGILPVKLVLISNEMPQLGDDSPALSGRFIILTTRQSFFGREDPALFETKLRPELVDVFHWALEGLRRLRKNRRFTEPQTSQDQRKEMAELGSLITVFLAERCTLDPEAVTIKDHLYDAYKAFAIVNGQPPDSKEKFFVALYAATSNKVAPYKPSEGKRTPSCRGIKLLTPEQLNMKLNGGRTRPGEPGHGDPAFDDRRPRAPYMP